MGTGSNPAVPAEALREGWEPVEGGAHKFLIYIKKSHINKYQIYEKMARNSSFLPEFLPKSSFLIKFKNFFCIVIILVYVLYIRFTNQI
ncbi:hypothetical protein BH09DEP1_BH09DEP1_7230 [soil metagenome]